MTPAQRAAVLRRRPSLDAQVQAALVGKKAVMLDMTDLSTLFQDTAGLTPVTAVTQPIGIVLDKSQGLVRGVEKVTGNTATFDTGVGSWIGYSSATIAAVGGELQITQNAINGRATITLPCTAGVVCEVSADVRSINGVGCALGVGIWSDGNGATFAPATTSATFTRQTLRMKSTDANPALINITVGCNGGGTGIFAVDNVSVKELPGNHATQPTAGSRPLYQVDGGYGCAQFDGINDLLSTAAIDLSASDKAVFSIAFAPNNFTPSILAEFGPGAVGTDGSFYLSFGEHGAGSWAAHARATTFDQVKNVSAITAGVPVVITVAFDLSSDVPSSRIIVRVNGAVVSTAVTYDQTGSASNFTSQIMNFGARAAGLYPSNSKIFTAALIGGALTVPEIELLDRWTRSKVGL